MRYVLRVTGLLMQNRSNVRRTQSSCLSIRLSCGEEQDYKVSWQHRTARRTPAASLIRGALATGAQTQSLWHLL